MFQMINEENERESFNTFSIKNTREKKKTTEEQKYGIASLIALKMSRLAKKYKKKDLDKALGYAHGAAKRLYDIKALSGYGMPFLERVLKQVEYIEKAEKLEQIHIYQSMIFSIERIFYTRYSGRRRKLGEDFIKIFPNASVRLSIDVPKFLNEYNNELCVYKENGQWYVDEVKNTDKTSPIGETWKDYKKTLLTPEERKEIDKKTSIDPIEETIRKRIELTKKSLEQAEKDLEYHLLLKRKYSESI